MRVGNLFYCGAPHMRLEKSSMGARVGKRRLFVGLILKRGGGGPLPLCILRLA